MDIHWTHNIYHGYNRNIIISMITSRAYSQQFPPCHGPTSASSRLTFTQGITNITRQDKTRAEGSHLLLVLRTDSVTYQNWKHHDDDSKGRWKDSRPATKLQLGSTIRACGSLTCVPRVELEDSLVLLGCHAWGLLQAWRWARKWSHMSCKNRCYHTYEKIGPCLHPN